jgi:hypothetical protein
VLCNDFLVQSRDAQHVLMWIIEDALLKALLCIIVGGQIGIRSLYDKLSFVNLEKDYLH